MTPGLLDADSRRGAYGALVALTLIWGMNWIAMKFGLRYAHPVIYNIERILIAIVLVFGVMLWKRLPLSLANTIGPLIVRNIP